MPDTPMVLVSHGWVEWEAALTHARGSRALWLDPTGYRYGPLPQVRPATTRIHAWDGQRSWRILPDADRVLLTELRREGEHVHPGDATVQAQAVVTQLQPWKPEYAGSVPEGLPLLERLEVSCSASTSTVACISFLRSRDLLPSG